MIEPGTLTRMNRCFYLYLSSGDRGTPRYGTKRGLAIYVQGDRFTISYQAVDYLDSSERRLA